MVEQIIEVDENNQQIGLRPRTDFFGKKFIHRSVHLIIFNSKNEILLQLRSRTKKLYPNLITYSVDGTVANESYEECIQREVKEELGISLKVKRLFTFPCFDEYDKAWRCVFVGKTDKKLTPDPRETQELKWVTPDELKKDLVKNPSKYVPTFVEGMKMYFTEFYNK